SSPDLTSTIQLNNSIFIKMSLYYNYVYGIGESKGLIIKQFLCFNSNNQMVFVFIPHTSLIVQ
ncbi:MAG: hypothetical protein P8Y23_18730, partial [Candidatus Lokiarchaeota archaeon]